MAIDARILQGVMTPDEVIQNGQRTQMNDQALKMNQQKIGDFERRVANEQAMFSQDQRLAQLDEASKKLDFTSQLLTSAVDQNSYSAAKQQAAQMGLDVSGIPDAYDPNYIRQVQMSTLTAKERLDSERADLLNNANVALRQAQAGTESAQQGTYRAQAGAYNALANERNAQAERNLREPQVGPISGDGTVNAAGVPLVNGKPVKLTEGQANANLYATRMDEANRELEGLMKRGYTPKIGSDTLSELPLGNFFTPEITQQAQQSQRNFINAVLRRESGAVISDEEFSNARKQYFPQPGDKPATLKQKENNRKTAIQGIRQAAGPAGTPQQADPLGIR